jgi:hypothetical protein
VCPISPALCRRAAPLVIAREYCQIALRWPIINPLGHPPWPAQCRAGKAAQLVHPSPRECIPGCSPRPNGIRHEAGNDVLARTALTRPNIEGLQ